MEENKPDISTLRHSTAHLLAAAVVSLFPGTKVAIGPAIEDGFYYDFDRPTPFTPEDLTKIEAIPRAPIGWWTRPSTSWTSWAPPRTSSTSR
jgi:threonyl-tRNA synthetase